MTQTSKKLVKSLSGDSIEILPYLSYLLQDLWELGSSPKDMYDLISRNIIITKDTRILDLACGKGAVSIYLAREFDCKVTGIDIMEEFIEIAKLKAIEYKVKDQCKFIVEDINQSIDYQSEYDIVIFGAVGDVLGNSLDTLNKLSKTIRSNGFIIIDDAYAKSEFDESYLTKGKWLKVIEDSDCQLLDEIQVDELTNKKLLDEQLEFLTKRVEELKILNPDKHYLFDEYLASQQEESNELENDIIGVTMLIKKLSR
jgi:cyclopropane fatty-acyl-phospholipid synthase-like methyltransferase